MRNMLKEKITAKTKALYKGNNARQNNKASKK